MVSVFKVRLRGYAHYWTAALVLPILILMGWLVAGYYAENSSRQAIVAGQQYPLLEGSGCRYPGGRCVLSNGDFHLDIDFDFRTRAVTLVADQRVKQVLVGSAQRPEDLPLQGEMLLTGQAWVGAFQKSISVEDRLTVAVVVDDAVFLDLFRLYLWRDEVTGYLSMTRLSISRVVPRRAAAKSAT